MIFWALYFDSQNMSKIKPHLVDNPKKLCLSSWYLFSCLASTLSCTQSMQGQIQEVFKGISQYGNYYLLLLKSMIAQLKQI